VVAPHGSSLGGHAAEHLHGAEGSEPLKLELQLHVGSGARGAVPSHVVIARPKTSLAAPQEVVQSQHPVRQLAQPPKLQPGRVGGHQDAWVHPSHPPGNPPWGSLGGQGAPRRLGPPIPLTWEPTSDTHRVKGSSGSLGPLIPPTWDLPLWDLAHNCGAIGVVLGTVGDVGVNLGPTGANLGPTEPTWGQSQALLGQ